MATFLKVLGALALGLLVYIFTPWYLYPSYRLRHDDMFYLLTVIGGTAFVVFLVTRGKVSDLNDLARGRGWDFKDIMSPNKWLILLTVIFLVGTTTIDNYAEDGAVLSILILFVFAFWYYTMKKLGGVSLWELAKKRSRITLVFIAIYAACGVGYVSYRWTKKFVPDYIARYDRTETMLLERYKKNNTTITPADLKKQVLEYEGPYPSATNYKAMVSRWALLWWTSAPSYFFTTILRDVWDWLSGYLFSYLDWLTAINLRTGKSKLRN